MLIFLSHKTTPLFKACTPPPQGDPKGLRVFTSDCLVFGPPQGERGDLARVESSCGTEFLWGHFLEESSHSEPRETPPGGVKVACVFPPSGKCFFQKWLSLPQGVFKTCMYKTHDTEDLRKT